jgi:archaellum biogenesis ATPase FlaH
MVKNELIKRSPLRILEKSIHGGVGEGNIGVIASDRGVGKTACLVHIATDKLFQDKHVIHLSFSAKTDHIIDWYETIFSEIAEKRKLEGVQEVHDEIIKNRVIMNFNQQGVSTDQVIRSLSALVGEGHFDAQVIVVDGYDFEHGKLETLKALRDFAKEHKIAIWATADIDNNVDERGVPAVLKSYIDEVNVLIDLQNKDDHIELNLVKDHDRYVDEDLHLKLEPKTLLIVEE